MTERTYTVTLSESERDHLVALLTADRNEFRGELDQRNDTQSVVDRFQARILTDELLRSRLFSAKEVV